MQRFLLGLAALVALAAAVGVITHWAVGIAVVAVPIFGVFLRLKLSPQFRESSDQRLASAIDSAK